MIHRAPDNDLGMLLGVAFVVVGCFFLLGGLFRRRNAIKADGVPDGRRPEDLIILRGWPLVFARMWLVVMGISMMGWGAAAFFDNLIYADTHHHQSGAGLVFWPTFVICLGSAAMFIQPSAVPNMKGIRLLFYRLVGLVFVCIGSYGVFVIFTVGAGLWPGLFSYIKDIEAFVASGRPIG